MKVKNKEREIKMTSVRLGNTEKCLENPNGGCLFLEGKMTKS